MPATLKIEKEEFLSTGEKKKITAKVRKLRALFDDDEKEQHETFDYLKKALDEDRPFNRQCFK